MSLQFARRNTRTIRAEQADKAELKKWDFVRVFENLRF
jgi:hypothetical protein